MAKQIFFDADGRQQIQRGAQKLARAVAVTLGPTGRNVMLEKKQGISTVTNDGLTITRDIELPQPFENMGAKLLAEVANRTNKEVGDGTTTAIVLTEAMIRHGQRFVAAGVSPVALRTGMEKAVEAAVAELATLARPVDGRRSIEHVATVASSHDPEVGKMIADAMTKVGRKGVVTVEDNDGTGTVLELVEGLDFDKGFISPYFITKPDGMVAIHEDPYLLITDRKISSIRDLVPILEAVVPTRRALFIVAEDVEGEALAGLIINRLRGTFEVVAIKAPGFGDRRKAMLEDFAVWSGGTFLSKDTGFDWESVTIEQLGSCKRIEVTKDRSVFFRGAGKKAAVEQRKRLIEAQIEQTNSSYDREKYEERIGKLSGAIAVIRVGGFTEPEQKSRKQKTQGALSATRAAMDEGVVPGGGTAFVRIADRVASMSASGDEKYGVEVVVAALSAPLQQLANNVGEDGPAIVADVEEAEADFGFDARAHKVHDLVKAGIIDAAKVLRVALQNAASIAALSLVSDAVVADIPKGGAAVVGSVT
ncbi:MAG: chaperonin GroEL [Planctomycetota bacterium]